MGVRFLDDVIDVNKFPLKQIEEATMQRRKIGLGVMGFAEMLIQMNISYASADAIRMAEEVMSYISKLGREESARLGRGARIVPIIRAVNPQKLGGHAKYHSHHHRSHGHHQHNCRNQQRD